MKPSPGKIAADFKIAAGFDVRRVGSREVASAGEIATMRVYAKEEVYYCTRS